MQILWQPRIGRGCVDCAALDENGHENNEANQHEEDAPPELGHPLDNCLYGLLVEEQVLQPHQRALRVYLAALAEHVAVALEVIAWGARPQAKALGDVQQAFVHQVLGGHAGVVVARPLTSQLAELALVGDRV